MTDKELQRLMERRLFQRSLDLIKEYVDYQHGRHDLPAEAPPLPIESDDYVAWLDSQLSPDLLELHEQMA